MKRKKALIFPYDISCVHMIINRSMILEYEISHVVSLKSWGYCDKDAGAHLKIHTGVNVSDDFETALSKVDTVIITDTIIPLDVCLMQMYTEKAIHAGKEVLDSRSVVEKPFACKNSLANGEIPQIKDIDKPLVVVVGTGTNTGFVDYNKSYIETMTEAVKNRFDYEVDSVFLSNFYINWEVTDVLDRLAYMTLPLDVVNQDAKECGCYSLYCEEDVDCFKKNMLSTLEGYSSIDVM